MSKADTKVETLLRQIGLSGKQLEHALQVCDVELIEDLADLRVRRCTNLQIIFFSFRSFFSSSPPSAIIVLACLLRARSAHTAHGPLWSCQAAGTSGSAHAAPRASWPRSRVDSLLLRNGRHPEGWIRRRSHAC